MNIESLMGYNKANDNKDKIDEFIEDKETKSNLKLLEERTEKTVELLNKFSKQVPVMIERFEKVGKYMEIDSINKVFNNIAENTEKVAQNQENIKEILNDFSFTGTELLNESKILIANKSSIFKYINWILVMIVIFLLIYISSTFKRLDDYMMRVNRDIQGVHNTMREDAKYWYDENNRQIFLREANKN